MRAGSSPPSRALDTRSPLSGSMLTGLNHHLFSHRIFILASSLQSESPPFHFIGSEYPKPTGQLTGWLGSFCPECVIHLLHCRLTVASQAEQFRKLRLGILHNDSTDTTQLHCAVHTSSQQRHQRPVLQHKAPLWWGLPSPQSKTRVAPMALLQRGGYG